MQKAVARHVCPRLLLVACLPPFERLRHSCELRMLFNSSQASLCLRLRRPFSLHNGSIPKRRARITNGFVCEAQPTTSQQRNVQFVNVHVGATNAPLRSGTSKSWAWRFEEGEG